MLADSKGFIVSLRFTLSVFKGICLPSSSLFRT